VKNSIPQPTPETVPQTIQEQDDFLGLFQHRWDYLYAQHPKPGEGPAWQTEGRFPLSDRHILEGRYLYGVRFGGNTNYLMLDIDAGSVYHPQRDRGAVYRIFNALEMLGLTDRISITSSYSGGLHIYFPLSESVLSWQLAAVVKELLSWKGFLVDDGLLEIFPNVRNYSTDGTPTLYKGHRLPLQAGSYLLDDWFQFQPVFNEREQFVKSWQFCQARNHINWALFNRVLGTIEHSYKKLGYKGQKFLDDLNTEIEPGWTDHGQTNRLLGRVTLRAYVFGHRIEGGEPLTGDRLISEIVKVATRLPGYEEWCRHKHEIYAKAEAWAKCVENSRYYPYGHHPTKQAKPDPTPGRKVNEWNHTQRTLARRRLDEAITELLYFGTLPEKITHRLQLLVKRWGFSAETLYKHPELWHPDYFGIEPTAKPVENPPDPPSSLSHSADFGSEGAKSAQTARSLLSQTERNAFADAAQGWLEGWISPQTGRNTALGAGSSVLDSDSGGGNCG
jgi:hypothetical protein